MSPEAVIERMRNGWELGADTPAITEGLPPNEPRHVWLQKGGIGSGGECVNVPVGTMELLERKKFIEEAPRTEHQVFWLARYRLYALRSSPRVVAALP